MAIECPRCRMEVAPDAAFCDQCGARLDVPCPGCQQSNRLTAKFCRHCGARVAGEAPVAPDRFASPQTYTPPHLAERILTSRAALEGERKQVSVLFADVENFTGLGGRLDPEELHALMDALFATLLDVIHRYEGTVNQFTGDGVMALFGAPLALEHHALRAVEAALEIQAAMRARAEEWRARWGGAPALRIGVHTGRVVVGKIGDDLRMDYTAQGDTVNLAARLQTLAAPGTVAISDATGRLVADRIECVSLGPHRVKGRDEAVEVFRPERVTTRRPRRFSPEHALSPLVGRDAELAALLDLYADVRRGETRVAIVTGEAGVGKSRLLFEFRQRIADSEPRWLEGHCVAYARTVPYHPIVDLLRFVFAIRDGDPEEIAVQKLETALDRLGQDGRTIAPALRYVLALGPADPEMSLLSPAERKASVALALDRLTRGLAGTAPTVVVFEDCQWMDPASDEYLAGLSRELSGRPIFLVLTCRTAESRQPAAVGPRIDLRPLLPSQARTLIRAVASETALSDELIGLAVDRTGGNPLFIEELTRAFIEHETVEIPPTVADVLTARIDRLPPAAKYVLQVASAIGREFSLRLLERVLAGDVEIVPALDLLARLGFVVEREDAPRSYLFRQGLLEEAAYEGMLLQRRKTLHRQIGEAVEDLNQDRLFEHVDVLAGHFLRAEEWSRAVFYLREAGRKAAAISANSEAVQRLERALETSSRLPETLERTRQAIDLRLDLRAPLMQLGRLEEVHRLSREAEELARVLGDERRLARVYTYLVDYYYLKGEPDQAIAYGQRCREIGDRPDAPGIERGARLHMATSYHALGRYAMAGEMLARNIADLEGGTEFTRAGPENILYVSSGGWLAFARAETGEFAEAHTVAGKALQAAEDAGNAYARAIAGTLAGLCWMRQGHADRALPLLEQAFELCRERRLILWQPIPSSLLGLGYALSDKLEVGLGLLHEAVAETHTLGINVYRSLWEAHLAEGLLVAGQWLRAIDVARSAIDLSATYKEAGHHARALMLLGAAYVCAGHDADRAEEPLVQALAEAEELRMRPLVAHCYLSLSRLAAARGQREKQAEYIATARTTVTALGMRFWWKLTTPDVETAPGRLRAAPETELPKSVSD